MVWAPDYVDVDETKNYVRVDDNVDNVQFARAIATASRAVDDHCRRQFGLVDGPEQRSYPVRWDRRRSRHVLDIDDLMITTGLTVTVGGVTLTSDQYRLEPVNAARKGKPWTELVLKGVCLPLRQWGSDGFESECFADAVGRWGWSAIPEPVKYATSVQGHRFLMRRFSPYGVAGSPSDGSEIRLLARLDPDVITALGSRLIRW